VTDVMARTNDLNMVGLPDRLSTAGPAASPEIQGSKSIAPSISVLFLFGRPEPSRN